MNVLIFNTIFADVVLILAVTYFEYWPKYVLKQEEISKTMQFEH